MVLPFDNGTAPHSKFVPDFFEHEHFVFALTGLPFVVNFKVGIVPSSCQRSFFMVFWQYGHPISFFFGDFCRKFVQNTNPTNHFLSVYKMLLIY